MSQTSSIQTTIDRMTHAFAAGDIDAILATYEPGGVLVAPGGVTIGGPSLRDAFAEFVALDPHFTFFDTQVIEAGDIALHLNTWKLAGTGPDGSPVEMGGLSAVVLRRQADGTWLMVIDHPTADEIMKEAA